MKVRLSYTVDADNVLEEAAKLLGNDAITLQGIIDSFNDIVALLKDEKDKFSINKYTEKTHKLRGLLATLDLKVMEISQIVEGYEDYCTLERRAPDEQEDVADEALSEEEI